MMMYRPLILGALIALFAASTQLHAQAIDSTTAITPLSCQQTPEAWIFCENFEKGDFQRWDNDPPRKHGTLTLLEEPSSSQAPTNHVLQLRVDPGRGGVALNKTFTPHEFKRLYARWYQQYEPGFDFTALNHGHGLHAGNRWLRGRSGHRPSGDDFFTAQVEYRPAYDRWPARSFIYTYYRGMKMDCQDPEGKCWGDVFPCLIDYRYCKRVPQAKPTSKPPPLQTGRWYCVELMVDAGEPSQEGETASGEMNFWLDGVQYGPWRNLWFRTDASVMLNHFWLGLFHHNKHAEAGILYDNVVISREPVGCD